MNGIAFSDLFDWNPAIRDFTVAIMALTICYGLYYFISVSENLKRRMLEKHGEALAQGRIIVAQRMIGGIFLGVPVLLAALILHDRGPEYFGLGLTRPGLTFIYCGALSAGVFVVNLLIARRPANLEQYPQIRQKEWSPELVIWSSFGWVVYLLGYELMFRGLVLFACVPIMGFFPAVIINASLYSLAHLIKGQAETFAAIPFGILISLITLHTGNMWTAFVVHCALALSNQFIALAAHPEMTVMDPKKPKKGKKGKKG